MKSVLKRNSAWFIAFCFAATAVSCQKDDPVPEVTLENRRVNEWILENMEREYYWNDQMPERPDMDLAPNDFFESLKSPEDRFSWMQESGQELSDNLAGKFKSFGYEMKLYYRSDDPEDKRIAAVVLYTYKGSEAAENGLRRGMWIGEVNGEDLTDGNYNELLFNTEVTQELSIGRLADNGDFTTEQTITVRATEIQEDPLYYSQVYTYQSKKVGYLVYNSFIPGPAGDTTGIYDQAIRDVFSDFKAAGVNELVLDLRYNLGGSVASAFKLAGYVMKDYREDNIFAMYEDNRERITPIPVGAFYEEENQPNLSALNRVYVLISSNTASASELIINGLAPYMDVVLIGDDVTVGKNVASITITDDRNVPEAEKIKYGLQPIVYKIYNSEMQSDFEDGFAPEIEVIENFAPFGDMNESFLSAALNDIAGGTVATQALKAAGPSRGNKVGSSLSRKPGKSGMYVKPNEGVPAD